MSNPDSDLDLGLAELDPIDPPPEIWDSAVSVAVDPSTPAPEGDLLPEGFAENEDTDDAPAMDDAAIDAADIDLSEFDDVDDSPHADADAHGVDPDGPGVHDAETTHGPADEIIHPTFTEADPLDAAPTYDGHADFSPEHEVDHHFPETGGSDGFDGGAHDADIIDL